MVEGKARTRTQQQGVPMEGLKVLLIDDETEFVTTLAERLELRGFDVRTAEDGEAGLRMVQEREPQVVVLDLRMPGLGGMEVLDRLHRGHASIPVILLTGMGSTREGIEGMQRGAFDFMIKPVDIDALLAKIGEAVEGRAGGEPGR